MRAIHRLLGILTLGACLLVPRCASAQGFPRVNTNGVLLFPTNLFQANQALILAALDGYLGGTGNAQTNAANAFAAAYTQTFLGPVVIGTTNLAAIIASIESSLAGKQTADADLDDLADGSLTGSKVGTGISGDNVTTGTVADARIDSTIARDSEVAAAYQPLDADLTDLADGSLTGSKVGTGISGDNITTGTVADARIDSTIARDSEVAAAYQPLDADLTDLADGSLTGSKVGTGIDAANVTTGTLPEARIPATIARTNAPTLHNATLLGTTTLETLDVTGALTAGAVAGSASGLTNINAGNISSGTLSTARYTRTGVPREIWIPASAMNPGTSDPPTAATNVWGTTTDAQPMEAWDFSASSTNSVFFLLTLPQQWNGSTVKAKVFWKQVTAEANTTNVWVIGGGSLNDGEAGGNTLGTLVAIGDQGKNDTNQLAISDASSAITIGGTPSAGHLTWFTVKRHPGNTSDNATVLGRLIGVLLQYVETATEASAW